MNSYFKIIVQGLLKSWHYHQTKSSATFSPPGTPALKTFTRQTTARGSTVNIQSDCRKLLQVSFFKLSLILPLCGHYGKETTRLFQTCWGLRRLRIPPSPTPACRKGSFPSAGSFSRLLHGTELSPLGFHSPPSACSCRMPPGHHPSNSGREAYPALARCNDNEI